MSELEALDPKRCIILMPVGNRVEPLAENALRELEAKGYPVERVYGHSAIDQARNQIATDALAEGFDELMWIDSDVGFDPLDVDRIRAHGLPFCCALYPKKGQRAFAFNFKEGTEVVHLGTEGGLLEIDRAGFGFTHTRREVYEAIVENEGLPTCNEVWGEAMTPYFQPMIVPDAKGHSYLAEDFAFCERAKRAGFKIMADTRMRLFHVGSYPYGWEDAGGNLERYAGYAFHVNK